MNILGNTLEEIAFEKAGIIKNNVPVVIGEVLPQTENIFFDKAAACKAARIGPRPRCRAGVLQGHWTRLRPNAEEFAVGRPGGRGRHRPVPRKELRTC